MHREVRVHVISLCGYNSCGCQKKDTVPHYIAEKQRMRVYFKYGPHTARDILMLKKESFL